MARLLIVDDSRPLVELLELILAKFGHEVVGHCTSVDQVLPAAQTGHDLVLMSLDLLRDINASLHVGLALTEALIERDARERVLIFTDVEGQEYVDLARRAGAAGYTSRSGSVDDLLEAIATVTAGGQHWPG